jgi:hypothetical protein
LEKFERTRKSIPEPIPHQINPEKIHQMLSEAIL